MRAGWVPEITRGGAAVKKILFSLFLMLQITRVFVFLRLVYLRKTFWSEGHYSAGDWKG